MAIENNDGYRALTAALDEYASASGPEADKAFDDMRAAAAVICARPDGQEILKSLEQRGETRYSRRGSYRNGLGMVKTAAEKSGLTFDPPQLAGTSVRTDSGVIRTAAINSLTA